MKVITICGPLKFKKEIEEMKLMLEKDFNIVHTPNFAYTADDIANMSMKNINKLHEVHYHKIDESDMVLVANVDGYIGSDTLREIYYAVEHGKPVIRYHKDIIMKNDDISLKNIISEWLIRETLSPDLFGIIYNNYK